MRLKELLKGIDAQIYGKVMRQEVFGISRDSRRVQVGDLFIAQRGAHLDGNSFSKHAVQNGAVAVLSSWYNPLLPVVQIITDQIAEIEARLAIKLYQNPSSQLGILGVTGTNGKTTVACLMKALLDACGSPSGLIGTIEHILGDCHLQSDFTTPTASMLHKYFAEMVKNRLRVVAMEVSSIGIALQRTMYTPFDVGVLTNISQDHLDFHRTMDEYVDAKKQFFASLSQSSVGVVNHDLDCKYAFIESTKARCVTYGIGEGATYQAKNLSLSVQNSRFDVCFNGQTVPCLSPLIGQHNVYNVLAAVAAVHQYLQCDLERVVNAVKACSSPKGRLEFVHGQPFSICIDYAHTPDALEHVCRTLSELLTQGRLIVVFGCGGDRDRGKRAMMARAVEKYGFAVVTSDNPRTENPERIIADICEGFAKNTSFAIEIDRKQAIAYALSIASDNDIVLIAGKGHETYQIFKHNTINFSDRKTVEEILAVPSL